MTKAEIAAGNDLLRKTAARRVAATVAGIRPTPIGSAAPASSELDDWDGLADDEREPPTATRRSKAQISARWPRTVGRFDMAALRLLDDAHDMFGGAKMPTDLLMLLTQLDDALPELCRAAGVGDSIYVDARTPQDPPAWSTTSTPRRNGANRLLHNTHFA